MCWGDGDGARCAWLVEGGGGGAGCCFLEAVFGSWMLSGAVTRSANERAGAKPRPFKYYCTRISWNFPTKTSRFALDSAALYVKSSNTSISFVKIHLPNALVMQPKDPSLSSSGPNIPVPAESSHDPKTNRMIAHAVACAVQTSL